MKNWKIGVRLGAGFGFVLVLMVVMLVISFNRMAAQSAAMDDIVNFRVERVKQSNDLIDMINARRIAIRDIILTTNEDDVRSLNESYNKLASDFKKLNEHMIADSTLEEAKQRLRAIQEQNELVSRENAVVMALALKNTEADNLEAASLLSSKIKPLQAKLVDLINDFIAWNTERMHNAYKQSHSDYQQARVMMMSLAALALALGAFIGWWITRSVTGPVRQAVKVAEAVAEGDLTQRIETDRNDETGQLIKALRKMNDGLVQIVGDIRQGVETINTASQEIAAGNVDLSQRTEEQAASLEETAASMEELTSTVKQNAENAVEATSVAHSASEIASKGGEAVNQVVTTMAEINESSKKIADIIGVIDGIAFQTNILALNAAVEAARAGEQGRGFAVVAGEVRSLAQRSAAAAKEIKALINDSVERVTLGTTQVDRAGETMAEVVESIRRVSTIMAEISAASAEQSSGIEQVNTAVTQMDEVTQQNAALVEEAAAAASSMQDQARLLVETVSRFRVASGSTLRAALPQRVQTPVRQAAHHAHHQSTSKRHAGTKAVSGSTPARVVAKPVATPTQADEDWQEF